MILAIGNTKGGVGKTTLSIQLSIARALSGNDVWLVDGDRQATASSALNIRNDDFPDRAISYSKYDGGKELFQQVKQQSPKYDDTVIDVGGRDSSALRYALMIADSLIVPFAPQSFDVWALQDIAELVSEANDLRDIPLRVHALLNLADPRKYSTDNIDASRAAKDVAGFDVIDIPVVRRKAYGNASSQGLSVLEYLPRDAKAISEIKKVESIVF
ncbi:hypothetical protein LMG33818_002640 [Halomonadaceae bacterium LMG 33818]|uniref:AAA family ATPase n=1 Tax=Cernens ardua TaxID=3402176 RepID=UPI003EDB98D9